MTPDEIEMFRLRYRLSVVEKMAMKALLLIAAQPPHTLSESHGDLRGWLDLCSASADHAYGRHFRDPGKTALFADEVQPIVEEIKTDLDAMVREIRQNLPGS